MKLLLHEWPAIHPLISDIHNGPKTHISLASCKSHHTLETGCELDGGKGNIWRKLEGLGRSLTFHPGALGCCERIIHDGLSQPTAVRERFIRYMRHTNFCLFHTTLVAVTGFFTTSASWLWETVVLQPGREGCCTVGASLTVATLSHGQHVFLVR